jgi:hypothetical protein
LEFEFVIKMLKIICGIFMFKGTLATSSSAASIGLQISQFDVSTVSSTATTVNYIPNTSFQPCLCDKTYTTCDAFCCCDKDCSQATLDVWIK